MTTDLEIQIGNALAAVRIRQTGSFSWFGEPSPSLSATLRRAMNGPTMRDYLRHQLQVRLYSDFYCKGSASPGVAQRSASRRPPASPFIVGLSAANTGAGAKEGGWQVVDVARDVVAMERDGLRIYAGHRDVWAEPEEIISPGQIRAVRFPKELLKLSPGFYMALGDESLTFEPGRVLVRLYWNLRADDAPRLIGRATQLLNGDRIAFRLKVLNDPALYGRCDAGVLYVQRTDYERVLPAIRGILTEIGARLGSAAPVFTKVLAPGLGLAEQPLASEDSFGMHRCRLLAEAILRIHERTVIEPSKRLAVVGEVFTEEGLSLAAPYLNPGSLDGYRF